MERSVNLSNPLRAVALLARALAPYALLELVMPGGTLLALLLYLYRRRTQRATDSRAAVDPVVA